jgi:DNA polymerase III alpha subunit
MTIKTLHALIKLNANVENVLNSYAYEAVRAGNRKIAHEIIKKMVKFPNWGFNNLHADVLDDHA